jgi:Relaxase/Mobilisation nuclease domain.
LATLKHINSKNADYGAAEQYLLFEHDEFTMKPVLDETGRLIPREDYRLSTLNCDGEDFAVACMRANLRYQKNQRREDVKSHHYIISFDPRDGPDNGLTVDRAQALGEQFCKEHFPGHQALVCTHPDGHNHSGNIHVHKVVALINAIGKVKKTNDCENKIVLQEQLMMHSLMSRSSCTNYTVLTKAEICI